jgi:DNA-binding winged helix-turn-helix (wHTH) protein
VKYEFGNVRVDASARTASISGLPVHLTRKALDLLLLLLECPQTVVSKDRIYERLWPDTFVTESGLQTLVYEIRHAIDDHRSGRSWIRTVRGIGYSFAGHVLVDGVPPERPPTYPAAWLTNAATSFPLYMGENVIGRAPDNPLDVQHPTISRRHACIAIGESITLEDLGSKNGTWLDDERVTAPRVLDDGAVVSFGSVTFTFRVARPHTSTASADPSHPPCGGRRLLHDATLPSSRT